MVQITVKLHQFSDDRFSISCVVWSVFCFLFLIQLSRECRAEVQRILHQRAMDVKLDPALQDKCLIDLGKWCSEKTEAGQVGGGAACLPCGDSSDAVHGDVVWRLQAP